MKLAKRLELAAAKRRRAESLLQQCDGKDANAVAQQLRVSGRALLHSDAWKALRERVFATYGERCMRCQAWRSARLAINVDHIKPRKYYPHLALEFDNLQVLCARCNKAKGNRDMTDWRRVSQRLNAPQSFEELTHDTTP